MALTSPTQPFVWGQGGQAMSPEQVARQREIAAALMQSGMDYSPVDHWLQGAARASQGLVGGLKDRWANEAETAGRNAYKTEFDSVFGGGSPVAAALADGGPPTALGAVNAVASIPTGDMASTVRNGLISRGLPEHVADAFILNMQDESGLNPGINEAAPIVPGSRGGYGLYQLTGPRRTAYEAFAGERGVDPSDVDAQLDFLMSELQGPEARAAEAIFAAQDTPTAAAAIVNKFLRPAEEHRARREAAYLGGSPRTQVAQAGGQPSIAQLIGLAGNEWASPGQNSVVQALLGQQMQQQDPRYQQQLRQGDLDYQRSQLEFEAMMNPSAPPPVFEGGQWWDTSSGMPTAITQPNVDPTSGMQNYEFLIAQGVAPEEAAARAFSGGVNVSVGGAAPAPAQGYQNIFDENGNLVRQEMVVGGPAWQEAQAAAAAAEAQEGAQIASGIEGAEKTLTSTRNVLDLIDNSGGQPTTGTLSIPFSALSGTPAGRIRSYVSTLQSGVALGAMQRLKEASATGATGFGALSAPELNLLISDIGALDPNNTEPDIFRETIQRIDERAKRVVADIRKNVAPERIDELGLREFLDAIDPPRNQSTPPRFSSQAEFDAAPSGTVFQAPDGSIRVKP